jgi:hypothetical protein
MRNVLNTLSYLGGLFVAVSLVIGLGMLIALTIKNIYQEVKYKTIERDLQRMLEHEKSK